MSSERDGTPSPVDIATRKIYAIAARSRSPTPTPFGQRETGQPKNGEEKNTITQNEEVRPELRKKHNFQKTNYRVDVCQILVKIHIKSQSKILFKKTSLNSSLEIISKFRFNLNLGMFSQI